MVLIALILVGAAGLFSTETPPFTERDKAFYMDEAMINFVRPGLVFTITGHEIGTDGTVKVRYKLTDPRGVGLDRLGITTPGNISTSFMIAKIPKGGQHYESYTTRSRTSNIPPTVGVQSLQAAADSGGTYRTIAVGEYEYTFGTKLPADYPKDATHTVGMWGSRNLSEFELGTDRQTILYNFVPNGAAVVDTREVIKNESCNKCHEQVRFHGSRIGLDLCVMCHTPAYGNVRNIQPQTLNEVDMAVMTHKIHMGADLPSVQAGTPYRWVASSIYDYSHVRHPADVRRCASCHEPGAKQANAWLTNPTRRACGSCHDNVNFATGENHLNLPQISDNQCKNCHIPEGELEFDASIKGAHTIPQESKMLPGINARIVNVSSHKAGEKPVVRFQITDNSGALIPMAQLNRVAFVMSGPTTDYVSPTSRGYVAEVATAANVTLSSSDYVYTMTNAIPADAKGTFSIGIETRRVNTVLEGTQKQMSVQYGAKNQVVHFAVDDSAVVPRRTIVTTEKCNDCHANFTIHGQNRNQVEQCVLCHNPVETDAARRSAALMPAEGISMSIMTHRIHAGNIQPRDYTLYGFGNTPHNYNKVGFSAPLSACTMCHVNGSENVPVAGVADLRDPRGYMDPVKPATGACIGCHVSKDAAAHALANTSAIGESCGVCHGVGKSAAVGKVHAR
ncbi:MAG: OmcA/MtrC family decaheme c-type cytochrome [Bryobacteraceae bacterium]|nr:OmcA/MtrC family decaheme c-type cytochrome [Bryobacteraceae bacterium]